MKQNYELNYLEIEENIQYENLIKNVINTCFLEEKIDNTNIYINIVLTNNIEIQKINKQFRNIDKETDVLSFPMFEKSELKDLFKNNIKEVLGDIIISMEKVNSQAKEYGHTTNRELAYMIVHGFYHILGYDHIENIDKIEMRKKEENILNILNIKR